MDDSSHGRHLLPTSAYAPPWDTLPQGSEGPFGRRNPDPGREYQRTFTLEVKTSIVRAVHKAYDVVFERHDPSLGFNANTFGYNVYHVGTHQLQTYCERSRGKLARVEELKSLCRFQSGGYILGFYKVGSSASTNIWEAFPTSDNGAMSVNDDRQMCLIPDTTIHRVDTLRYVVVAHLGNPIDGLQAIYLCIPIQTKDGKIKRWGFVEELFLRGRSTSVLPPPFAPPPEDPVPPVAPEEEPEADVVVTAR